MGLVSRKKLELQKFTDKGHPRCQAKVDFYIGRWPAVKQCELRATVGEFCRVHNPEAVEARQKRTADRNKKQWHEDMCKVYAPTFYAALKKIANGENDARKTARDAIRAYEKILKE